MTDELLPAEGISRREMLKRSAVVGGASAMVWAAPSLTTFAPRAFGNNGSPASDFSNFGAIIVCDGQRYRVKYDKDKAQWVDAGTLGGCESAAYPGFPNFFTDWCNSLKADGGTLGTGGVGITIIVNENVQMVAPAGCTFVEGAAAALKQGQCCYLGSVSDDKTTLTFDGPFDNQDCAASGGVKPGKATTCP
jgi:hypothetical protein